MKGLSLQKSLTPKRFVELAMEVKMIGMPENFCQVQTLKLIMAEEE
jgi:hypothetical protein